MLSKKSFSMTWIICAVILFGVPFLIWTKGGHAQMRSHQLDSTLLQGSIFLKPVKIPNEMDQMQQCSQVKLKAVVENKGKEINAPGHIYVRFAFSRPLDQQPNSVMFQTEKLALPSIEPGLKAEIEFAAIHQLPSLLDFVRDDWLMREYQVVVQAEQVEKVIGALAITFSAYYYPGISKEIPAAFPAL